MRAFDGCTQNAKNGHFGASYDQRSKCAVLQQEFETFTVYHRNGKMQGKSGKRNNFVKNISNRKFGGSMVYLEKIWEEA